MTTARKAKPQGPPTFYASEYVDISIDPEDLERAGWRYVGDENDETSLPEEVALDVVMRWHDDTHQGPWVWCREEPCDTLRGRPHDNSRSAR